MSRKPKSNHTLAKVVLILLILVMIAASIYVIKLCLDLVNLEAAPQPSQTITLPIPGGDTEPTETEAPPETTLPEPEHVVSTATIGTMGDILMHLPVVDTGRQTDGSYNFESIFRYISEYVSDVDFAAANLETTLASTDNGYAYSGFPHFNCPDAIVDGAKDAGFDMLLTGNNHSYDTTLVGYKRTLEVVREAGLGTLGTMLTAEEPKYVIQEINGINIGMISYTYATRATEDGRPSLNGNAPISEVGLCNYFVTGNPGAFYTEIEGYLDEMRAAGAETTVVFMHWGVEYNTFANEEQKTIAQKLCDMGVDVIIGGHPHVVQPIDLLDSTVDPDHKTICLYSMGNAVSNQRLGNISTVSTAHTEDGVLFSVTFEKYSDGTVYVQSTDILPTWVNMSTVNGKKEYNILPLDYDRLSEWQSLYNLTDSLYNSAQKSYDRTTAIVGDGLTECQTYLEEQKAEREQYLSLIHI